MNEQKLISQTRHWVETVVVGLNFCPFAKKELANTRYLVCGHERMVRAIEALLDECDYLDAHPEIATSLLIYPQFEDYEQYLALLEEANRSLDNNQLRGTYQLASFHPQYCFADEPADSAAHYTNRAPHPVLHLLREASIEQVLARYREPEAIPERNIATAKKLGAEAMQALLATCRQL
ncbi:DUF1415 domain-containing protein [Bowmanella denitrificans]|uniref:DUF1415 domain-containing protein n=1 Tax=Bowmanella denitrificans TaxID=366582 RepID=A0ABN0XIW6_9ALTE